MAGDYAGKGLNNDRPLRTADVNNVYTCDEQVLST